MDLFLSNKRALNIVSNSVIFLTAIAVIVFVFLVFNDYSLDSNKSRIRQSSNTALLESGFVLKSVEKYLDIVSSKSLFRQLSLQRSKEVAKKSIDDVTRDLILNGVVSVGNKEAIIKNRRTRQTYFVNVGSKIGDVEVVLIEDGKVDVSFEGERKTLFLK